MLPKPGEIIPARAVNPGHILFIGPPKLGKTRVCAEFTRVPENKALLVDFDPREGTRYVDSSYVSILGVMKEENVDRYGALKLILKAIKTAGYPYKWGILDDLSNLEEICIDIAGDMYMKSPLRDTDFNPERDGILNLPHGAGYDWLRRAFGRTINAFSTAFNGRLIMIGHTRDAEMADKKGDVVIQQIVSSKALQLTGKQRVIVPSRVDATAYLWLKDVPGGEPPEIWANFRTTTKESASTGTRCAHLVGQNMKFVWDNIILPNVD